MAFRTTHFYVERLMVWPQSGYMTIGGVTTVSSIPGQWVGGASIPMGGATSVQFTASGQALTPRLRLNQTILGGPQASDEVIGQYRLAQKLGHFPLGGGHVVTWTGKYGLLAIGGSTNVVFGSQKNGLGDQFTSKLGLSLSRFRNFTLGYGGAISYTDSTGSLSSMVGNTSVAITGNLLVFSSSDWFKYPFLTVNTTERNASNEYIGTKDWVQYPTLLNITTTHEGLNYLDVPAILRSSRINVPDPYPFTQIFFVNNITTWPAMNVASATLASKTIRSSTMLSFTYHRIKIDRKLPITYTLGIVGNTSTNINSQFKGGGTTNVTAGTSVNILGSQVYQGLDAIAGNTSFGVTGQIYQTGPIEADGQTTFTINAQGLDAQGFQPTGQTIMTITLASGTYWEGTWEGDGLTTVAPTGQWVAGAVAAITGVTTVSVFANQIYNTPISMAGTTSVNITAWQKYADSAEWAGVCNVYYNNTIREANGDINMYGQTDFLCDAIADYFIAINANGATDVNWDGNQLEATAQIYMGPGITNWYEDAVKGQLLYEVCNGATNFAIGTQVIYNSISFFWLMSTGCSFTPQVKTNGYLAITGSSSLGITPSQNQMGTVICNQIDQEMSALGSFIYTDGQIHPTDTSAITLTSKLIAMGSQYYSCIVQNEKTDVTEIPSMSFTLSGKTSRSVGTGEVGSFLFRRSVGFTHQTTNFINPAITKIDITTEEFVKIPLFVYNSIITENSISLGFTLDGESATAGVGDLGYLLGEFATIGILTNVRNTLETLEILATGNPNLDVTQVCYELLYTKTPAAVNTQIVEEILYLANCGVIQQVAMETLATSNPHALVNETAIEAISSIKAEAIATQEALEILATGDPNVIETQVALEILTLDQLVFYANAIINDCALEAIGKGLGNIFFNDEAVEVIHNNSPHARINDQSIDVIHNNNRNGRINSVVIDIINNGTNRGLLQQVVVEMLVKPEFDPEVAGMVNNPRYHIG